MTTFNVTREIGIDAGHRVTNHGSKCRNVHGHRYKIQVTCQGNLRDNGEEEGMVMDFGFLKEEMMRGIDKPCDHGLMLWMEDPLVLDFCTRGTLEDDLGHRLPHEDVVKLVTQYLAVQYNVRGYGKVYVMSKVPTAENLAYLWYHVMMMAVGMRTDDRAKVLKVRVWETPYCYAEYPA